MARTILSIFLFALSLVGLILTAYADQYVNGGVSWGQVLPSVNHTDVNPLGVNVFLEKEVEADKVERSLQMVQDGGYGWIRQSFPWNDLEISGKGDFVDRRGTGPWVDAWAKYDRIVDGASKHGLQIIARLDSPPVWARMPGDDVQAFPKGPPANYEDYADFVGKVAARYKGKVKYFQIWNEPNLYGEWGGHPISAKEYTALLKAAYEAIKKANPEAVVITAALAPTAENSLANQNDVLYLEEMYREGAGQYFDILSTMLYGLGQSPNERRTDLSRLNFSRPILLRRVMEENGDAHKPIWISEYAWISLPPDFDGDPSKNIWGDNVDEETQGKWLVEGYERAAAEWPWMGVMNVWHFRQPDPIPGEPANYFAIVRDDFTPRPAYDAIKEYGKQISSPWHVPVEKPLWNALVFPLLYGLFGLLALVSGGYALSRLGVWAGAALDRPRGRYSEAARETARNGAVVVGMALLVGVYYKSDSLPIIVLSLTGWALLAFIKPSIALAAVAFAIPFFWYPKTLGRQNFPIAETLLILTFGAFIARKLVVFAMPEFASRLGLAQSDKTQDAPDLPGIRDGGDGLGSIPTKQLSSEMLSSQSEDNGELAPARWPTRPLTAPLSDVDTHLTTVFEVRKAAIAVSQEIDGGYGEQAHVPAPTENSHAQEPSTDFVQTFKRSNVQMFKRFREWSNEDAFAPQAVALLIVGTFSLFTLADPAFAKDSLRAYRWVIVEPVLFYFLMTDVIRGRRGLWRMADFFVAAAVLVSFVGLGQFALGAGTLEVQEVSRVFGVYKHPNNLALYLGRVLPFVACVGIFLPWGWRKMLYLMAIVPLAMTTLLTYSRGAYLAVALSIAVVITVGLLWKPRQIGSAASVAGRRDKWLLYASGGALAFGVALIIFAAILPILPSRITNIGSGVLRLGLWESSLNMLRDHPIFGVGPDQFLNQFQAHYMTEAQKGEAYTAHPHNLVFDYWLSLGIMGLLILIWLLWRYFREALIKVKQAAMGADWGHDLAGRAIALGLLASMLDFVLHGLVDNSYFLMDLAMIFWLCCGMLQLVRMRET